jgi:hypothetical protein
MSEEGLRWWMASSSRVIRKSELLLAEGNHSVSLDAFEQLFVLI